MIDKGQWGGFGPGHRGYTPTLYVKCYGIFNDHRESGHRFNVSFERQCSLTVKCPRPGWGLHLDDVEDTVCIFSDTI